MTGALRKFFGASAVGVTTVGMLAVGALAPAHADGRHGGGHGQTGRFDVVHDGFMSPRTTLSDADPAQLGLDPDPIAAAWAEIDSYADPTDPEVRPLYASSVGIMGHAGKVVSRHHDGYSLLYSDGAGTQLPPGERIEATPETIYDMASVSKLFTSIVVMQLVEDGLVDLDATYGSYVPEFANGGKEEITVSQLLTHTSGLVAWLPLWSQYPDVESRIRAVMEVEVSNPPGTVYEYSDLNLIALGVLAERLTGDPLDVLVREGITEPLGMVDTGYNPDPALKQRIAATEFQATPDRGIVWGEVHDENAWSLGGVAGHAGVFSTAQDMAVLAQTFLNGGAYGKARILSENSVRAMVTNLNEEFGSDAHGLGFELDQMWYMGGLSSPATAGHTGYTGTSLVIDFQSRSFVVLLTNRVHPSRSWGSNNPARRAAAAGLARALAVAPEKGRSAWYGGTANASEATLTVAVPDGRRVSVEFSAFADLEPTDTFALEASADGGETWELVPFTVERGRGRHAVRVETDGTWNNQGNRDWGRADARVPEGSQLVRWRYTTDSNTQGRGVFVDAVKVRDGRRVVLNGESRPEAFDADGFTEVRR
ncbi:serine hydrolase domain-containing protein [Tessaracoccus terricola]